jgi:hypothetical protein
MIGNVDPGKRDGRLLVPEGIGGIGRRRPEGLKTHGHQGENVG